MTLPDNRVRFPAGLVDFTTEVGITGQDHDEYPSPGTQARYDHIRLYLLGLLAQQSSYTEPTQYRDGTPWFDLNDATLKIRSNDEWVDYAEVIGVLDTNLKEWIDEVNAIVSGFKQEIIFSGTSVGTTSSITIPTSLRTYLNSNSRALLYINGLLQNPNYCSIISNTTIVLSTISLTAGDTFTVNIRTIPSTSFYTSDVII